MDIQKMMQQAKEMQDRMQQMQEELAEREVQSEAGGGLVKVTMTCRGEIRKLDIAPEIIDRDEKETLEDLVMAAINLARQKADQTMADETQKMMQDMGLPANVELPGF